MSVDRTDAAYVAEVAELIAGARLGHAALRDLPEHLQPASFDPVETILLAIHERIPWETAGWKIGAASDEVQRLERLPGPVPGRLYRRRLLPSPARLGPATLINHCNVESEFAFVLGADLPHRDEPYEVAEIEQVVTSMVPVLEIGDSVFPDWYGSSRYYGPCIDNGGGAALILGEPTLDWRRLDLARHPIDLSVNGRHHRRGYGSAAMGHPLRSLTWLANWTSKHGFDLKQGELISTGTCTSHCFAGLGDEVSADFGELGEVRVTYAPEEDA
jgi:2-keto-4-pentenoate hydratase